MPQEYGADRTVAVGSVLLALYSAGHSVVYTVRYPAAALRVESWAVYLSIEGGALALQLWIAWGVLRSRFWGLMALLVLMAPSVVLALVRHRASVFALLDAVIAFYAVARLFTLVGPRPIRRQGFHERV